MPVVNPLARELVFKVVYYGPGLGGKTTTLQHIHAQVVRREQVDERGCSACGAASSEGRGSRTSSARISFSARRSGVRVTG